MKYKPDNKRLGVIVQEIQEYFGFLFEKGCKIDNAEILPMGDWRITLQMDDIRITIFSDREDIDLIFIPSSSNWSDRVGLASMVFFLSDEQVFLGRIKKSFFNDRKKKLQKLADTLKKYIDSIQLCLGKDYERYKPVIKACSQKYGDRYLRAYDPGYSRSRNKTEL